MDNALYYLDSNAVKRLIQAQELKQYWVADQAGVHVTTLRRWLTHRIYQVRAKHISRLAAVLGVNPKELIPAFREPSEVKEIPSSSLPTFPETA